MLRVKPENISVSSLQVSITDPLLAKIKELLPVDEYFVRVLSLDPPDPLLTIRDGLLYRENRIYVPSTELQLDILRRFHDSISSGHFGVRKTVDLVSRQFWWPRMIRFIKDYCRSCEVCMRSKSSRHKPYGLLKPLPISPGPWRSVSLDFIVSLPLSAGFDAIMVVVCRFTKMSHFIPCSTTITAMESAKLFFDHVYRLHGSPETIISDRGPQFIAHFWKRFFELLGTEVVTSTAFHPQTDGQTERTNQTLEQYLRSFSSYNQDNWVSLLSSAEFSYNNSFHASIQCSPFYANYGFNPIHSFHSVLPSSVPAAEEHIHFLQSLHSELSSTLSRAVAVQKEFADRKRSPHPDLPIGSLVYLDARNIRTLRPSKKLDYKKLGPFKVLAQINPVAYRLELPLSLSRLHPVFHVSLLEPVYLSGIPGRSQDPPPPVSVDSSSTPSFEVADILDVRVFRNRLEYLVTWKGFGPSDNAWDPLDNLDNCDDILSSFHLHFSAKIESLERELAQKRLAPGRRSKKGGTVRTPGPAMPIN